MAGVLILLGFSGLVLAAGFAYFMRRSRIGALAVLGGAGALLWWAGHYFHALSTAGALTPEQEWHRTYLVWLLIGVPCALLVGGLIGFQLRRRAYMAQYVGLE